MELNRQTTPFSNVHAYKQIPMKTTHLSVLPIFTKVSSLSLYMFMTM